METDQAPPPQLPAYGYNTRLGGTSLVDARKRVTEALKEQGFGIITEIDMQATLKNKIGVDFRPYVILGACNPVLANRALDVALGVGLLLPCNVCLWEEDGGTVVSLVRPEAMFEAAKLPALQPIADEVGARLRAVLAGLEEWSSDRTVTTATGADRR